MVVWLRFCFIYKIIFCKPCLNFAIHLQILHFLAKCFGISLLTVEKKTIILCNSSGNWNVKKVIITQGVIMWDWRALLSHIIQIFEWKIIRYYYSYMSVTCVFFYRHLMFPTLILYILSFILKKCALILKWCVWPLSVLFLINCPGLVCSYII